MGAAARKLLLLKCLGTKVPQEKFPSAAAAGVWPRGQEIRPLGPGRLMSGFPYREEIKSLRFCLAGPYFWVMAVQFSTELSEPRRV